MSDDLMTEYDFGDDVSLAPDEKNVGGTKQEWLKMTIKGQVVRASFLYFYTYDANAVQCAMKVAAKAGKKLTKEEVLAVAKEALTARATELGKTLDQLTAGEKLDPRIAHFKAMKAHYQEGMGFILSRLGKDGAEADAVWKRLPEPKPYFSTLLLIYPTNNEGTLNKEEFARQIKENKLKLVPWRFGNKIYEDIWKLNDGLRENNLSLASQDIKLECKEPQYQNIAVSFVGASTWQKNQQIASAVLTGAANMYDKLMPFREMTTDQLRAKLGLSTAASDDVSSDNFQDVLDSV
jgi:hypothetical protein